jgi:hypothetical protein
MRVAARFLFAGLCLTLIFSVMGALSGSHADVPERGAAFHKPHHPLSAIEPAPVSNTTSFKDGWIAAPVAGFVLHVDLSARPATQRTSRVPTALAPEAALNQRPPPRTLVV